MKKIKAIIEKADDGGISIYSEDVNGAYGFGLTEQEAKEELERITTIKNYAEYENSYKDFTGNSNLDVEVSKYDYSVSNRGLRPELVGTPKQVAEKIRAYKEAGLDLLIVQCANMQQELEYIAKKVFPLL